VAAGNSEAKIFRQTVAEIFREVVVKFQCSTHGGVFDGEWRGSGDGHDQPDKGRERKAAERADLKEDGVRRTEVMDDGKGEDKDDGRDRGQSDESYINDAVKLLPRVALIALGEMSFVVAAHLRREAGDVIAPSREDVADEWINTLTHINL